MFLCCYREGTHITLPNATLIKLTQIYRAFCFSAGEFLNDLEKVFVGILPCQLNTRYPTGRHCLATCSGLNPHVSVCLGFFTCQLHVVSAFQPVSCFGMSYYIQVCNLFDLHMNASVNFIRI